jgi:hypothetical protein
MEKAIKGELKEKPINHMQLHKVSEDVPKVPLRPVRKRKPRNEVKLANAGVRMEEQLKLTLMALADRFGYDSLSTLCRVLLKSSLDALGLLPESIPRETTTPAPRPTSRRKNHGATD